jgi:hypothetical protein
MIVGSYLPIAEHPGDRLDPESWRIAARSAAQARTDEEECGHMAIIAIKGPQNALLEGHP